MQDLDSFTSSIPGFESDILIPAILVSAREPGVESSQGPSIGSKAGPSRTRASKRKAPIHPSCQKKAKKAPTSTPPSGTQKGIPVFRSKRYAYLQYFHLWFAYESTSFHA
jgi:hypothetical protein